MTEFDFEDCRAKLRTATRIVLDKEVEFERVIQRSADAEAVYRSELGKRFAGYREDGKAVEESTTLARRDVATLSRERDYARDLVKVAAAKLEDARDARRSLWRLIEWARDRDNRLAGQQMTLDGQAGR
jgi:hypothetical protein